MIFYPVKISFIILAIVLQSLGILYGQSYFYSPVEDKTIVEILDSKYNFLEYGDIKIPQDLEYPDWLHEYYQLTVDSVLSEKNQVDSIIRLDINGNNALDVLFSHGKRSNTSYIFLDVTTDSIEVFRLRNMSQPVFNFIDYSDGVLTYIYAQKSRYSDSLHRGIAYDVRERKLIHKYGGIVEYNDDVETEDILIDSIVVNTTGCYGSCPVYDLKIERNSNVYLNAKRYCKASNGKKMDRGYYHSKIKTDNINLLEQVLGYIDFSNLSSKYAVDWTDDQTITVTVYASNGEIHSVRDYGMQGTMGLSYFYSILNNIYRTSVWE